jgi:hypothetical protein
VELEQTSIAMQGLGKHIPSETNKHATIEGQTFLCNGEVKHTSLTIGELFGYGVFYVVHVDML